MCLDLTSKSRLCIATKDITVYKHVIQIEPNKFVTTYRKQSGKIGKLYRSRMIMGTDTVEKAIHSYTNKRYAVLDIQDEYCRSRRDVCMVLMKCIIPKGAKYIKGKYFIYPTAIASNKLKYVEVLATYNYDYTKSKVTKLP